MHYNLAGHAIRVHELFLTHRRTNQVNSATLTTERASQNGSETVQVLCLVTRNIARSDKWSCLGVISGFVKLQTVFTKPPWG